MNNTIVIRAFRAVDDPDTCNQFYTGHVNVLRSYGITPVSSSKKEWFDNPAVYGLIAELNGQTVGGVKIHKVGGTQALPMEDSVGYMDAGVYDFVKKYTPRGTGEACGLWNAREVAGWGVSLVLMHAMISISPEAGVNWLLSLSSNHTVEMCRRLGYRVVHSLGNDGDFEYPTPEYIARVIILNTKTLSWSSPYNREIIMSLRERPNQIRTEDGSKGGLRVDYRLTVPGK